MQVTTEQLFTEARTQNGYHADAVSDEQLRALYDLLTWGPTYEIYRSGGVGSL